MGQSASRGFPFLIILWHLITGLRSLASTGSHQTIKGTKISTRSTLRKVMRCFERGEFFRNRADDELVQRRAVLARNLFDRPFERSRQAEGIVAAGSHFTISFRIPAAVTTAYPNSLWSRVTLRMLNVAIASAWRLTAASSRL